MLPVFMILRCKIYFMRAAARQLKYRIKELERQTDSTQVFRRVEFALFRGRYEGGKQTCTKCTVKFVQNFLFFLSQFGLLKRLYICKEKI